MNDQLIGRLLSLSIPVPEAGCWLWLASRYRCGYGQVSWKRKTTAAHRASYTAFVGEIPSGMFVCHKCDTRSCINPDHLFLGTAKDNSDDMIAKGRKAYVAPKTHCYRGHAFTEANTHLPQRGGRTVKVCRACNAISAAASKRRKAQS